MVEKKDKEIKDKEPIKLPEPPKEPEYLPPIPFTKLEVKLYTSKVAVHIAMGNQVNNILNTLANENRRALQEVIAENHDIDLTERKYEFDAETLAFIDYKIIRERVRTQMGNPALTIPGRR